MLNDVWGEPYIYKGIRIYPITMQNAEKFYNCVTCLIINKNGIPNAEVIKMSYLDFLINLNFSKENKEIFNNFIQLLELVLKEQKFHIIQDKITHQYIIKVISDNNSIEQFNILQQRYNELIKQFEENYNTNDINHIEQIKIKIEEIDKQLTMIINCATTINGNDFKEFRHIVLHQNLIKYDDELINEEIKQALAEAQAFIDKKNKDKIATIEELIISYVCNICNGTPSDYQSVKNLTIYQFNKGLQRKNLSKQQDMLSTALGMGCLKPENMVSWLDHIKEGNMYDDSILTKEEINQIKQIDK